jgi:hypothetical protein
VFFDDLEKLREHSFASRSFFRLPRSFLGVIFWGIKYPKKVRRSLICHKNIFQRKRFLGVSLPAITHPSPIIHHLPTPYLLPLSTFTLASHTHHKVKKRSSAIHQSSSAHISIITSPIALVPFVVFSDFIAASNSVNFHRRPSLSEPTHFYLHRIVLVSSSRIHLTQEELLQRPPSLLSLNN